MRLTACECQEPGWCERHKCHKPRIWWYLCRTMQNEFEEWEQGRGRGQREPTWFARLPPCRHRSLEPVDHFLCDLCGGKKGWLPVFACQVFGRCSEGRVGTRTETLRALSSCVGCEAYAPAEATC